MPYLLLHPHLTVARRAAAWRCPSRRRSRSPRSPSPGARPPRPHAAPSVAAASAVEITGAGSTFDAPFFTAAFAAYQQAHPGVAVSYAAVGSSAGITRFTAGQVELRRHRRPRQPRRPGRRQRQRRVQVPVDLGAVAVAYNAITNGTGPLRLTGPVIARIFLGQITKWDDPAITALNPGAELPDAYITVVHRSDGSGTTYIFSNYLSEVSPAWASAVGTGRSLRWPAGIGADGNAGVAADIARIPYSIGYTERSYVTGTAAVGCAAIPTRTATTSSRPPPRSPPTPPRKPAITAGRLLHRQRARPRPRYPISGYSWVLLSARQPSHDRREGPDRAHQLAHPRRAVLRRRRRLRAPARRRPAARHHHPRPRHRPRRTAAHQLTGGEALAAVASPGPACTPCRSGGSAACPHDYSVTVLV